MKNKLKWVIKLAFTVSLFILIFNPKFFGIQKEFIPVTLEGLWNEIKGIDTGLFFKWILVAMGIKAMGMLSSMLRWDLLLKGQAIKLPFKHLMGTFLVGRFFGMFLPSTIGLDGYRLYDVAKHTGKVVESTTVILIEKLIGVIALTFLVFITLPLGLRFLPIKPLILAAVLVVLAAFIAAAFIMLFNPKIIQIALAIMPIPGRSKIQGKIDKIAQAVTVYSGQKALLAKALVLGFFVHLFTALMYFGTAMAINTKGIDILDILFTSPLMIYGTVIGPSIGGEGIREIIFALILGAKAGSTKAVLFAHLGFWVGEVLSLAGGIIYIVRPAEYRPKSEEIQEVMQKTQAEGAKASVAEEGLQIIRNNIGQAIRAGLMCGIWAGFIVGILEAFVTVFSFNNLSEHTVLYWGPVGYGLLGLFMGAGVALLGSVFTLFRTRAYKPGSLWAFCFVTAFFPLAFIIARFRLVRDFLHERALTLGETMGLLVVFVVVCLALYWIIKLLYNSRVFRSVLGGVGAPVCWVLIIAAAFIYNATAFSGAGSEAQTPDAQRSGEYTNVILIMADALRADYLPAYGYTKNSTPNIDALARDGILYVNNFAQSSWTKPQSATLLTSLYPSTHNTYLKPHVLPEEIDTVAEIMKKAGYRTGGVVSNINLSPVFNFQQGFEYYCYLSPDYFFRAKESSSKLCLYNLLRLVRIRFFSKKKYVNHYYQKGEVVNDHAMAWLDQVKDQPFFLFMHYMDPHDPYFAHPFNGEGIARASQPNPPPELAERMIELYNQDIKYMDDQFGVFVQFLKDRGLYDKTMIVFTADHGEEFYDHGGWWHGTTLYDEQIRIPLIIKLPGSKQRGTVDTRIARSLDVAPTIIGAAGAAVPGAMQGMDLFSGEERPESSYAEEDHEHNVIQSIRTESWKLILTEEGSPRMAAPVELFDVENDAGEKTNLAEEKPEKVKKFSTAIRKLVEKILGNAYNASEGEIDEATQDRLKALGYVE